MKLISLNSGCNGSGMSTAVALEATLPNAMSSSLYALCLVNAGDSIQKFAMDSNVKFSKLQFIVITSLSPHCVSGLPGLILGLSGIGLASLTIIGPIGLAKYMDSAKAFTNRMYPVCEYVELVDCSEKVVEFSLDRMGDLARTLVAHRLAVRCRGVAGGTSQAPIGACYSLALCGAPYVPSKVLLGCFPVPFGTNVSPTLSSCLQWAHSNPPSAAPGNRASRLPCALFVPLECVSSNIDPLHSRVWMSVADLCLDDASLDNAIFADGCLRSDVVEFRTAQANNLLYNAIAPQLFPFPLSGLADCVTAQSGALNACARGPVLPAPSNRCADAELDLSDREAYRDESCCRVFRSVPLMSVELLPCSGEGVSWGRVEDAIAVSFVEQDRTICAAAAPEAPTVPPNITASSLVVSVSGNRNAAQDLKMQLLGRKRKLDGGTAFAAPPAAQSVCPPRPPPPPCPFPGQQPPALAPSKMAVTFLGTGSATPSKHRNNTCIMLHERSDGTPRTLLLDVGEGTSAQLFYHCSVAARVGSQEQSAVELYWQYLRSIEIIWISHHHGDHLSGLLMLIEQVRRAWLNAPPAPTGVSHQRILIIASNIVLTYAEAALRLVGLLDYVECYPIGMSTPNSRDEANFLCGQRVAAATGGWLCSLVSIPVIHCPMAFAVVLVFYNGLKIVYSGDCRPVLSESDEIVPSGPQYGATDSSSSSRVFARYAVNCDLLIHESTFEDALQSDAISKRHCTISEALTVARLVGARATVLTHFSQRYPKVIDLSDSTASNERVAPLVAFDLMTVSLPMLGGGVEELGAIMKLTEALARLEKQIDGNEPTDPLVAVSSPNRNSI